MAEAKIKIRSPKQGVIKYEWKKFHGTWVHIQKTISSVVELV